MITVNNKHLFSPLSSFSQLYLVGNEEVVYLCGCFLSVCFGEGKGLKDAKGSSQFFSRKKEKRFGANG